ALGGERHGKPATAIERDETPASAAARDFGERAPCCAVEWHRGELHERGEAKGCVATQERFAVARARYRYRRVGVGAGADDRRIAHAPGKLVREPARGGGGCQPPAAVERNRAYGAVAVLLAECQCARADALERIPALLGVEIRVRHEVEAVSAGESDRTLAGKQDVRASLHDGPRERDGIAHAANRCHRARAQSGAVHDAGIELDRSARRENRAPPGIEER